MSAAIELVNVTKNYGPVVAVRDLSLAVPEGSLFGLIGPNGAGKTTTFSLLAGFIYPTAGEVRVRGQLLSSGRPPIGQIVALPQDANLPEHLRALDCLTMLGRFGGFEKVEAKRRAEQALQRVGLTDLADRKIAAMSHGQRRRVGIASTLIGENEVILLDEPTAGLDPRTAAELRLLIKELREHRTIVISSHNLLEIEALCDHAAILNKGILVECGRMDAIKNTESIVQVSLARVLTDPNAVLLLLRAVPGVRSANLGEDASKIDLTLGDAAEEEGIVNNVLKALLEAGASVRGVDRGKSLEQKFLERTSPENASRLE